MAKKKWMITVTYNFMMETDTCDDDTFGPDEGEIYDQLEADFPKIDRDNWEWEQTEEIN